jgi:hypothetical protein
LLHRSSLEKLSGTGSLCKGDDLSTSVSMSYSVGSRCRTTDFAAPWSRCQTLEAASLL